MEEKSSIGKKENYKVTIILKDEIVVVYFFKLNTAIETVKGLRKLCPNIFIGGAIEEKKKEWKVIWTLGAATTDE